MIRWKMPFAAFGAYVLVLFLPGCGGGHAGAPGATSSASRASAVVKIVWGNAQNSRFISVAADTVQVQVYANNSLIGQQSVKRPANTITFAQLPLSGLSFVAEAYNSTDPRNASTPTIFLSSGVLPAPGDPNYPSGQMKLTPGGSNQLTFTLVSNVAQILVSPANLQLQPGGNVTLQVTAVDQAGEVILSAPSDFDFVSSNPGVASVDAGGVVKCLTNGTATITVFEAGSPTNERKSISVSLNTQSLIYFLGSVNGNTDGIYSLNPDGSGVTLAYGFPPLAVGESGGVGYFAISPDGTKIADTGLAYATVNGSNASFFVNVVDLKSKTSQPIFSFQSGGLTQVAWVNNKIYFLGSPNGNTDGIYSLNPDGSGVTLAYGFPPLAVGESGGVAAFAISPDGTKMAYTDLAYAVSGSNASFFVNVVDLKSKTSQPIFSFQSGGLTQVAWVNNKIYFLGSPNGNTYGIYSLNPDGSGVTLAYGFPPQTTGGVDYFAISPDGTKMAYEDLNQTGFTVNVVDLKSKAAQPIFSFQNGGLKQVVWQ